MKRIAIFTPDFGGGGAERMMLRLSDFFLNKGFLVDYIVVRKEGPLQYLIPQQANIIVLNSKRTVFSLPKLVAYLRNRRPNVILSTLHTANWIAALAKLLSCVDSRLVARVAIFTSGTANKAKSLDNHLSKLLYPIVSRIAFSIVGVSAKVTKDLVKHYRVQESKIKTIHNPSYNEDIFIMGKKPLNHTWFDDKTPVVLGVGRLSPQKDFNTLLKAFYLLRQTIESKLIILGEGPEREKLERTIKQLQLENDVELPGFVVNPYCYMARASVFVASSIYEGFPNVLVESLALNTPVVSTDSEGGAREILENGKWGKLVPVGNAELLSAAIFETLREEKRVDLQQRAKQFDLETAGNEYLKAMGICEV
jgi:glycosyltransferase involved in cell wall biosynthesis